MEKKGALIPRGKKDYIPVFGWLIGKRFAYVLAVMLILLGILGLFFFSPIRIPTGEGRYRVFDYDSWLLKLYKGDGAIRAASGYIAYIGEIGGGTANGEGMLYCENGVAVYDGEFQDGMYHGSGKLYDTGANLVYEGNFSRNLVVYEELVGKKTSELAEKYHGKQEIYGQEDAMCVYMPDIEAVYYAKDQENALEEEWMALGIYVLRQEFPAGEELLHTMAELEGYFGEPEYTGTTAAEFQDVTALWLWKTRKEESESTLLETEEALENVYQVTAFWPQQELEISTFLKDGYLYTFFGGKGEKVFSFYLIEAET